MIKTVISGKTVIRGGGLHCDYKFYKVLLMYVEMARTKVQSTTFVRLCCIKFC